MRFFDEFGIGDMKITQNPLFVITKENPQLHISMANKGFHRDKLRSLFTEEQLEEFFASDFYATIAGVITPFEHHKLFTHATPDENDARLILGVIRHPERWLADVVYDQENHTLQYVGELTNKIAMTQSLFANDEDPLPQESINVNRSMVHYSELLPMLDMAKDIFSQIDYLLPFFLETALFPFGKKGVHPYRKDHPRAWTPTAMSMIMLDMIHDDMRRIAVNDKNVLAWVMALDFASFRHQFNHQTIIKAIEYGMQPHDYVNMLDRKINDFDVLYNAWINDIDETMWAQLEAGKKTT